MPPRPLAPPPSSATPLLDATLRRLASVPATRGIPASLLHPAYDPVFGESVCQLTRQVCAARGSSYEAAVDDFIDGCRAFLRLQRGLERTGRYACTSFAAARRDVYDNAEIMGTTYLHSLLLSQALWLNHYRLFAAFGDTFCANVPPFGRVLEVPSGTGLHLSEFARQNPAWQATGVDLSEAAVVFARQVAGLSGAARVTFRQQDVFELDASTPFDRVICGELLEHVEQPAALLAKLRELLAPGGRLFLTTAIWAANPDHIYLFESAQQVRAMVRQAFDVIEEWVWPLEPGASAEASRIPINYGCVLGHRGG